MSIWSTYFQSPNDMKLTEISLFLLRHKSFKHRILIVLPLLEAMGITYYISSSSGGGST
jgi:hypothetical protein